MAAKKLFPPFAIAIFSCLFRGRLCSPGDLVRSVVPLVPLFSHLSSMPSIFATSPLPCKESPPCCFSLRVFGVPSLPSGSSFPGGAPWRWNFPSIPFISSKRFVQGHPGKNSPPSRFLFRSSSFLDRYAFFTSAVPSPPFFLNGGGHIIKKKGSRFPSPLSVPRSLLLTPPPPDGQAPLFRLNDRSTLSSMECPPLGFPC